MSYRLILLRVVLIVVGAVAGLFVGFHIGEASFGIVASLLDRHLFDPKEMLLALAFSGALLGASGAIWLALLLTRAGRIWRLGGLILTALAALGSIAMIASAFHWPTSGGPPLVQYELRLPPGARTPLLNETNVNILSGNTTYGVSIERIRNVGGRPEIAGDIVIGLNNQSPTLQLRLRGGGTTTEGSWRLPYRPDSPLEPAFGPWQRIEFIPNPRSNAVPLPAGDYEIRYRLRRYMRHYHPQR